LTGFVRLAFAGKYQRLSSPFAGRATEPIHVSGVMRRMGIVLPPALAAGIEGAM